MRKTIVLFLNIISIIISTVTLCIISVRFPDNTLYETASEPTYFNSEEFSDLCNSRINLLFNYINLKQAFESYGSFDPNKIISIVLNNGMTRVITINDALELAKNYNISITNDYRVVFDVISDSDIEDTESINYYNYYGKNIHTPTDTVRLSRREFVFTFMEDLANYRNYTDRLFSNKNNFQFFLLYDYKIYGNAIFTNSSTADLEEIYDNNFIYINSSERLNTTNIKNINQNLSENLQKFNPLQLESDDYNYIFTLMIKNSLSYNDDFKEAKLQYDKNKNQSATLLSILIYSFAVFLITLFMLLILIFNTKININTTQNILISMPIETHIIIYFIFLILAYLIIGLGKNTNIYLIDRKNRIYTYIVSYYVITIIFFYILSLKYESNTLTSDFIRNLKLDIDNQLKVFSKKGLFWFAIFPVFMIFAMGMYIFYTSVKQNITSITIIGLLLILIALIISIYLLILFRNFTDTINEKNKSNELKSTLISNISHDIKTPLTSIINYSELIYSDLTNKKSITKQDSENLIEYSSIIKDKSNRLNLLINDIIFDSKVTSGNLKYDIIKLNIIEFIEQMILEFSPDLTDAHLKTVFNHPNSAIYINADSEKLYRVFQNLFSNIIKYSLPNSMVFIDVTNEKNKVKINIRNIQKDPINADSDTLKERFWQGDESRSNTVFGLGLSITNSLIKGMGGTFTANASRDIFLTTITFLNKK